MALIRVNMALFALTTLFLLEVSVLSSCLEFNDDDRLKRSKRARQWQILDDKGKTFKDVPDWQDFTPSPGPSLNDVIFESSDNVYHGYPRYTASSGNILARSTTPAAAAMLSEYYPEYKSPLGEVENLKMIQSHVNRLKLASTTPSPPKVVPDVDPNMLRVPRTSTVSGRRMMVYEKEQNQINAKLMEAVMPRVEHHAPFELDERPQYDGRAESLRNPWIPESVKPGVLAPGSALEAFKLKYGPTTERRRRTRRRKLTTTPPFATTPMEDEYELDETDIVADKNLPNENNYIPNITFKPKLPKFGIPENRRANIFEESQLTNIHADSEDTLTRIISKSTTERNRQSLFKSKKNKMVNIDPQLTDEDDFTRVGSKIKTTNKIPQLFDMSESRKANIDPQFTDDDLVADNDSTQTLFKNNTEDIIPPKYGVSENRRANTDPQVTYDEMFKSPPQFDILRKGEDRIDSKFLADVDIQKNKDLASYLSDEEFRNFIMKSKINKNIFDFASSNKTKDPLEFFLPPPVNDQSTGKERLGKIDPQLTDEDDFSLAGSKIKTTNKIPLKFGMSESRKTNIDPQLTYYDLFAEDELTKTLYKNNTEDKIASKYSTSENRRVNTDPLVTHDEEFKIPSKFDILGKDKERIDPKLFADVTRKIHKDLAGDLSDEEFGKFLDRSEHVKKLTDSISSNTTEYPLDFFLPPSKDDKSTGKERLEKMDGTLKKLLEPENESIEEPEIEKNESDYEIMGIPIR